MTTALPAPAAFAGRFLFGATTAAVGVLAMTGGHVPLTWLLAAMIFTGFGRAMEWL